MSDLAVSDVAGRRHSGERRAGTGPRSGLLDELDRMAWLLDSRWRVPGTGFHFGVDALAGLVPGIGDAATGLVSAYMVWRAREFGVPTHVLVRMIANVGVDSLAGAVPVVGSLFDFAFKANRRNMRLLRRHLERESRRG